jgi:hypothetical protein
LAKCQRADCIESETRFPFLKKAAAERDPPRFDLQTPRPKMNFPAA